MQAPLSSSLFDLYSYSMAQSPTRVKPKGQASSSFSQAQATAEALVRSIPRTLRHQPEPTTVAATNSTARKFIGENPNIIVKGRHRTTTDQQIELEKAYSENEMPDGAMRQVIAERLKMPVKSVHIWFQNRRAKSRMEEKSKEQHNNGPLLPSHLETLPLRRASTIGVMTIPQPVAKALTPPQAMSTAIPNSSPMNSRPVFRPAAILPNPQSFYASRHFEPYPMPMPMPTSATAARQPPSAVPARPRAAPSGRPRSNSYQALFQKRYKEQMALLQRSTASLRNASRSISIPPAPPLNLRSSKEQVHLPALVPVPLSASARPVQPRTGLPLPSKSQIRTISAPDRSYYTYAPDPRTQVRLPGISEIIPRDVLARMDADAK